LFVEQFLNGISLGMIYALIAIGFTLIFGVLNLINFAHGEIYMIGAFVAFTFVTIGGLSLPVAFLLSIIVAGFMGVLMERVAFRPLRKSFPEATLLATLGLSIVMKEAATLIWGPETHTISNNAQTMFKLGSVNVSLSQVSIFVVALLFMIGLHLFLTKTYWGMAIRALAQNREAASLMGVNVNLIISVTFAIGSAMGGAAGVLTGSYYGAFYPSMGFLPGLKAFVAMVLGGLTSIPGAVVGGLFLGLSESMASSYLPSGWKDAIAFILLLLVLLIFPQGITKRKEA